MAKRRPAPPSARADSRDKQPQRLAVLVSAVLAVVVPVVHATDLQVPGRPVLALLFVLLVPGAPVVALLRLRPLALYTALVFAVSISTLLLMSLLLLQANSSHPRLATALIGLIGLYFTRLALSLEPVPDGPAPARTQHDARQRWVSLGAVLVSVLLWVVAVSTVDLDRLGALGLLAQVGPVYWLALGLLAAVGAWHVRRAEPDPVAMGAVVLALGLELYGFLNAADTAASFPTGWLHVGFVQYIADTGHVAHYYDARFSWPAFFVSMGYLTDAAGLPNAVPLIAPAPVIDIWLLLPGVWSLARTITGSPQLAWVSLLTFLSLNWYGQEYFSPQATVYVLYVGVLAVLLHLAPPPETLVGRDAPWRHPFSRIWASVPRPADSGPYLSLGREAVVLVVCTAVTVSHQLTPINLLMTLTILVLTGATRMRGLWLLLSLVFIAWFVFGAFEFWRSNIGGILADVGNLGSTVGSSVGGRVVGDPLHIRMQTVRIAWSAGSVVLALITVLRLRNTTWFWLLLALALGPFGLLAVQSYGGEVALRSFLYAEPILATLMAMTVMWALSRVPRPALWPVLSLLLLTAFTMHTTTHGTNAAFERMPQSDVDASRFAFEAPRQGPNPRTIGVVEGSGLAGFEHVTQWQPVALDPASCLGELDVEPCVTTAAPDFLLLSRSMDAYGVLQDGERPGWTLRLAQALEAKGLYTRAFSEHGSLVLQRRGPRP